LAGAGVAEDNALGLGDEQAVTVGRRVVAEPLLALFDGPRLEIERDRGVDDVVVVKVVESR
jgi:hypothetical protein